MLKYSVIVPHYNDVVRLAACIRSLLEQTTDKAHYEIIVVDNNSSQSLQEIARHFGENIILQYEHRKGAAHARNCGLAIARSDRILFTDADCTVASDWIEALGSSLGQSDMCGGRIIVTASGLKNRSAVEWFETLFAFDQENYIKVKRFSVTANLGCRRAVVDAVGEFRQGVSEDTDWCWRAADLGFHLAYNHNAIVYHPARRTIGELCAKWRRLTDQDIQLRQDRGAGRAYLVLRQVMTLFSPFVHTSRIFKEPGIPLGTRFAVTAVLFYIRLFRAQYGFRCITGRSTGAYGRNRA